jgi:regulatory protein YycH of two-component signal transduction system YycFG
MKKHKRLFTTLIVVLVLIFLNIAYYLITNWQNFSIIKNSLPSSGETVSLQTYKNSKMGFEIQYPASWVVQESENNVTVDPPAGEGTQTYFSVAQRGDFKSLDDVKKTLAPDIPLTSVQISGASGFEYSDSASYQSIWLLYSNNIYLIRTYSSLSLGDVANQILATFKFIN